MKLQLMTFLKLILAASNEDSGVYLVGPDSDALPGMKVS